MPESVEIEEGVERVVVYASGLLACSACAPADMPVEEIERQVNGQNPTGISSRWAVADEPFAGGEPNPSPCHDGPLKKHYLFTC